MKSMTTNASVPTTDSRNQKATTILGATLAAPVDVGSVST